MTYIPKKPQRRYKYFYVVDDKFIIRMIKAEYIDLLYELLEDYRFILNHAIEYKNDYYEIIEESTGCTIYQQENKNDIAKNCIQKIEEYGITAFQQLIKNVRAELKIRKIDLMSMRTPTEQTARSLKKELIKISKKYKKEKLTKKLN